MNNIISLRERELIAFKIIKDVSSSLKNLLSDDIDIIRSRYSIEIYIRNNITSNGYKKRRQAPIIVVHAHSEKINYVSVTTGCDGMSKIMESNEVECVLSELMKNPDLERYLIYSDVKPAKWG